MPPLCVSGFLSTSGFHTSHANRVQDTLKALSEEVDEELIPVVYGGSNALPLSESPQEIELRTLVDRLNS